MTTIENEKMSRKMINFEKYWVMVTTKKRRTFEQSKTALNV
jgi:hypothetical protein